MKHSGSMLVRAVVIAAGLLALATQDVRAADSAVSG